jgi:mono/diheme cytochrome c family protein
MILTRFDLKIFRYTIAACVLSFAFTMTSAQTQPSDTSLTTNPVFQQNCAKCHGKNAEGKHFGGPSLITEKTAGASSDDLRSIIADGKGHMPKYSGKISSAEIDTLVRQIAALNKK